MDHSTRNAIKQRKIRERRKKKIKREVEEALKLLENIGETK